MLVLVKVMQGRCVTSNAHPVGVGVGVTASVSPVSTSARLTGVWKHVTCTTMMLVMTPVYHVTPSVPVITRLRATTSVTDL
jgi:hypothetical protein